MPVKRILTVAVLLSVLCGCSYQAQLLDPKQMNPGGAVIVQCQVKKPIIKVSESGDFFFWAAGGPGLISVSVAYLVNESNNDRYRKMLKSAFEADYFSERFEAGLRKALDKNGFQATKITIEYKSPETIENPDCKYILRLRVRCGLFKSNAQSVGRIQGRLIRVADGEVLWKNRLSFEGQSAAEHKCFGDGKEAVEQWCEDEAALRNCLLEVLDGAVELLGRELAGCDADQKQRALVQLRLKNNEKFKASIIEESQERIVVRLEGGAVRSIPAEQVVSIKR